MDAPACARVGSDKFPIRGRVDNASRPYQMVGKREAHVFGACLGKPTPSHHRISQDTEDQCEALC